MHTFFLVRRPASGLERVGFLLAEGEALRGIVLERLLVVGEPRCGLVSRRPCLSTAFGRTALGLDHFGRGPPEARADLVGDDLDLGTLLAVLGLPGALLQ